MAAKFQHGLIVAVATSFSRQLAREDSLSLVRAISKSEQADLSIPNRQIATSTTTKETRQEIMGLGA
jgi:hypothetical protein